MWIFNVQNRTGLAIAASLVLTPAALSHAQAQTQPKTLVFSSYTVQSFVPYQVMLDWAKQVEKDSGGTIAFEFHHSGSLLDDRESVPGIRDGRADGGIVTTLVQPADFPLTEISGIPFVTRNTEAQGRALLKLYEENDAYRQEWERNGLRPLAVGLVGPFILAGKQPIETLDDMKKLRLRGCGYTGRAMAAVGVETASITQSEQYEAVERGVLGGIACVGLDSAIAYKYQDIAPHVTDPGTGVYAQTFVVISDAAWKDLPEQAQDAITKNQDFYMKTVVEHLGQEESKACDAFKEAGGSFHVFSDADIQSWKDQAQPAALDTWSTSVSATGVDADTFLEAYLTAVKAAEANSSYTPPVARCAAN